MIERHGDLFINRVYTPAEIDFCNSRNQSTQHFAGRWAAKEAILRAIGLGYRKAVSWKDIEIRQGPDGRPAAHLTGGALEICQKLGITGMMLTISHCRSHATASALALGVAQPQPINSTLIDKLW